MRQLTGDRRRAANFTEILAWTIKWPDLKITNYQSTMAKAFIRLCLAFDTAEDIDEVPTEPIFTYKVKIYIMMEIN